MDIKIYQIPGNGPDFRVYGFTSWEDTVKAAGSMAIPRERYKLVWQQRRKKDEPRNVLVKITEIFAFCPPKEFRGRSLSVSDVVELDGTPYFCDSFGWQKVKWEEGET